MINLLGCSKDNFIKLLKLMNYKVEKGEKENEIHFRYMPKNTNNKKKLLKKLQVMLKRFDLMHTNI